MASGRDLLRAVSDYQRPLHDPNKVFTTAKKITVDGVVLTIQTNTLIVRTEDKVAMADLKGTLSILEPSASQVKHGKP